MPNPQKIKRKKRDNITIQREKKKIKIERHVQALKNQKKKKRIEKKKKEKKEEATRRSPCAYAHGLFCQLRKNASPQIGRAHV